MASSSNVNVERVKKILEKTSNWDLQKLRDLDVDLDTMMQNREKQPWEETQEWWDVDETPSTSTSTSTHRTWDLSRKRKHSEDDGKGRHLRQLFERAKHVVAILDLDGHMINKKFMPKELAIKGLGDSRPLSLFFFNEEVLYKNLEKSDKRTCDYVQQHVFDIPYWKFWYGMLKPNAIDKVIRMASKQEYGECPEAQYRDKEPWIVAYKGGHCEKDLLDKLNIPSLNLEELGCPKVEKIEYRHKLNNCGMHRLGGKLMRHCPTIEVQLFEQWLRRFMADHNQEFYYDDYALPNPAHYIDRMDYAYPPFL